MAILRKTKWFQRQSGFTLFEPGFEYIEEPIGGNITLSSGNWTTDNINGVLRQHVWWDKDPQLGPNGWRIEAGANVTMTFRVLATQGVSGSYYNEVFVFDQGGASMPSIFEDIGIVGGYSTYSWNSGTVIVPAYDSETSSEGENVTVNFGLDPGGVTINSWIIK
jgi:hypothetical protein